MLSSPRTLRSPSLQGSTKSNIVSNHTRTSRAPPNPVFAFHRGFSWGSKHKNNTSHAGKVCKGFVSRIYTGKDMTRKQLYRSALWGDHHFRQYFPKYFPIQEWRFSSSWGKNPDTFSSSRDKVETSEEEDDWYTRWEKQKLKQYDAFVKRVEHDPYTALFGTSWLNPSGEKTGTEAARTPSPRGPKENFTPKNETSPKTCASKSKSSGSKSFETRNTDERQLKSDAMPDKERNQQYEIDPITNRKVLKTSASSVSTIGSVDPQVEDVGEPYKMWYKRWDIVSPSPLDRRFVMIEHAQASSSSHHSSKVTPPKPQNKEGWLAQEGFGKSKEPKAGAQAKCQTSDAKPDTTITKIESALDRHLSSKNTIEKAKHDRPQLNYKPEENKMDDVDLLRPSDVRASAGLRGKPPKETMNDKHARRQKLDEKLDGRSLDSTRDSNGEAASSNSSQKEEVRLAEMKTAPEPCESSQLEGTRHDARRRDDKGSKDTSIALVNKLSNAKDLNSVSVDQTPDSMPVSKHGLVPEPLNAVAHQAQFDAGGKASKLQARIVPFKAKLDAMKAHYDSLRQQWLREIQNVKDIAAKKEEEWKARKLAKAKSLGEIHEAEIKTQKQAMEAMETRRSDGSANKTALEQGIGSDAEEKLAPRRLQSFLQGEGDMASNVHEFAARDRWYKRKAPHAMDAKDVEMSAKLQKLATDRALIREVRSIYEDTYGVIDTEHRQPEVFPGQLTKESTSSSGKLALQARSPSSPASVVDSSRGPDEPQCSDPLEIIQKLFGQLRDAQSIVQDYRCPTTHALGLNEQDANKSKASSAFENIVIQIVRTSGQLARASPARMIDQGFGEAVIPSHLKKPIVNDQLSTTAPKHTNPIKPETSTELSAYRILVYDSATQMVRSTETTKLTSFSKEEPLLPMDALNRLSNPGTFLPHVLSLVENGYKPVSSTKNILVLKKAITPQTLVEIKESDDADDPTGNWALDSTTKEDALKERLAQLHGMEPKQQKVDETQKQAAEKNGKVKEEDQEVEEAYQTARDDIENEEQRFQKAQEQQPTSSVSPSHTWRDKVHRQERVFSGARRVDSSAKAKKSKLATGKRRKTLKRMVMAGAITAVCCYTVGVVTEVMHSP